MPDLSIIIPIYNTPEETLTRCFSSLDSLTGISCEILLVDDGSHPSVGAFCKQYALEHPLFQYLYKENGGASSARNYGLDYASGRYVMFADADDVILGGPVCTELQNCFADLVIFDMQLYENDTDRTWYALPYESGAVSRETLLQHLITGKSLNSPCAKLFLRTVIADNSLRFRTDFLTGEDWLFVTDFALYSHNIRYIRKPSYRYYRDESSSHSRLARFPNQMIGNCIAIWDRKCKIISSTVNDHTLGRSLMSSAAVLLIEDLFNSAADLLLLKKLTAKRRERIFSAVRTAGMELLPSAPRKARLKYTVLMHFPWLLWPLGKLRKIYLKRK